MIRLESKKRKYFAEKSRKIVVNIFRTMQINSFGLSKLPILLNTDLMMKNLKIPQAISTTIKIKVMQMEP